MLNEPLRTILRMVVIKTKLVSSFLHSNILVTACFIDRPALGTIVAGFWHHRNNTIRFEWIHLFTLPQVSRCSRNTPASDSWRKVQPTNDMTDKVAFDEYQSERLKFSGTTTKPFDSRRRRSMDGDRLPVRLAHACVAAHSRLVTIYSRSVHVDDVSSYTSC